MPRKALIALACLFVAWGGALYAANKALDKALSNLGGGKIYAE